MENKNAKSGADQDEGVEFVQLGGFPMSGENVQTGWLLDDGVLCVGAGGDAGLALVNYSHPSAIRFARETDARAFTRVLQGIGFNALAANVRPVEHQWG